MGKGKKEIGQGLMEKYSTREKGNEKEKRHRKREWRKERERYGARTET
jgi:hypothetical protein